MNIPYFASRNHSRRFSFAGSEGRGGGVCAAPLAATNAPQIRDTIALHMTQL
jgi:hypothetical protein